MVQNHGFWFDTPFLETRLYLCLFYLLCYLPLSLKKSLADHKASMKREELYVLLEALTMGNFHEYYLSKYLQVLMDEGVVACLFADEPYHMKGEVKEILSRIREKLSTCKEYIKFKMKYDRESEGNIAGRTDWG